MDKNMNPIKLNQFKHITHEKLRYRDTDRQGHINNSLFATFLETARTELLYVTLNIDMEKNTFVIANLNINFLNEIKWPGIVHIGSTIEKIGRSSFTLFQAIFQNDLLVSTATSVIVEVDLDTKKSKPMSEDLKDQLKNYLL